jgi:hypothetical protein
VRNKLDTLPHQFDYEYFYVTFDQYDGENHRDKINVVNEMERVINQALKCGLSPDFVEHLMNELKGTGYIRPAEREKREALMTTERRGKVDALVGAVLDHLMTFCPEAVVALPPTSRASSYPLPA